MADLSTRSIKDAPTAAEVLAGNLTEGDARTIRMIVAIGERRMGAVYTVDAALAHHYCEVIKVAEYVKDEPAKPEGPSTESNAPEPESVEDRAMRPPPRGRRK